VRDHPARTSLPVPFGGPITPPNHLVRMAWVDASSWQSQRSRRA
jgi:hypothetical protein